MKLFVALLAGLIPCAVGWSTTTTQCNADNCARAVTGTRLGPAHVTTAQSDCSVQVAAPTPTIPSYVHNCPNVESYISACNCWGITNTGCTNPGSCGSYNNIFDPACGPVGDCFCGHDADGRAVCVQDEACADAVPCSIDADCASGQVCLAADNCCGFALCINKSTICANPPVKMRRRLEGEKIYKKRGGECKQAAGGPIC